MRIPRAIYRIQLTPPFGFRAAKEIVPYLAELGISDVYGSPIFKARRGSFHGYDVVDPNTLNLEQGAESDFEALSNELKAHDMGWLQDVVPNHMAFDPENEMLIDGSGGHAAGDERTAAPRDYERIGESAVGCAR